MSLVLLSLVLSLALSVANICPNDQFRLVARYRELFKLDQQHKRYWIAFGTAGKWTITLVDTQDVTKDKNPKQAFKCKENSWGSVDKVSPAGYLLKFVGFVKETVSEGVDLAGFREKIDRNDPVVCCAAPHSIDEVKDGQIEPFAVLPGQEFATEEGGTFDSYESMKTQGSRVSDYYKSGDGATAESRDEFTWVQVKHVRWQGRRAVGSKVKNKFWKWILMRSSNDDLGLSGQWPWDEYVYPSSLRIRSPSIDNIGLCGASEGGKECHTGIMNDIVVFRVTCEYFEFLRFAFSSDGTFLLTPLFNCEPGSWTGNGLPRGEIYYFPITKLYVPEGTIPAYNEMGLGWKLGSFCASCPSTSFKMSISEKEAQMNKKRLQQSFAIGLSAAVQGPLQAGAARALTPLAKKTAKAGPGASLAANVQYTRTWFEEAATTITSGRSTVISASCNGLYLWYWTVSVGSWGEGMSDIPCQFFYCTDRSTPPVCKPRISASMISKTKAFGPLCDGHDVASDFGLSSGGDETPWATFHSGRPKPLRLQGQKRKEGALVVRRERRQKHAVDTKREHEERTLRKLTDMYPARKLHRAESHAALAVQKPKPVVGSDRELRIHRRGSHVAGPKKTESM
eukprot:85414_1